MTRRSLPSSLLAAGLSVATLAAVDPARAAEKRSPALKQAALLQEAFAQVAEKVFPSVVSLTSFERRETAADNDNAESGSSDSPSLRGWREAISANERYASMKRLASGTGFVLSEDGYILTALDFLKKSNGELADLVDVEAPDGETWIADVVGTEPTLNLALLKMVLHRDARRTPVLSALPIADPESIRVGNWVIAVGDPLGPQQVFAAGLLSTRPERGCYQAELAATFLEASLQVHPEAYGGPLVDLDGKAIGMIVPHRVEPFDAPAGGSVYALPMTIATGIYESLKVARTFESPWLGVSVLSMQEYRELLRRKGLGRDVSQPVMGIYIDNVFDPSPAARADLRVGDILLSVNGEQMETVFQFQRSLYLTGVGGKANLEIDRNREKITRQVTVEARPAAANVATGN
jgi:S1-C subfamily serine protease